MLWMICDRLHKLPNDPLIKELSDFQLRWLFYNIIHTNDVQREQLEKVAEQYDGENQPMNLNKEGDSSYSFDMGEKFDELIGKATNANK